mgnify:FL=1
MLFQYNVQYSIQYIVQYIVRYNIQYVANTIVSVYGGACTHCTFDFYFRSARVLSETHGETKQESPQKRVPKKKKIKKNSTGEDDYWEYTSHDDYKKKVATSTGIGYYTGDCGDSVLEERLRQERKQELIATVSSFRSSLIVLS